MFRRPLALTLGVLLLATSAAAQVSTVIRQDEKGRPSLVPKATLPESPAWLKGTTNANGGIDWKSTTAPVSRLEDGSGNAPTETCEVGQVELGLLLSQPDTRTCRIAQDPAYRVTYTDYEAAAFALTSSVPGTWNTTYTEGASFKQNTSDGYTRVEGTRFPLKCTGLTFDGTTRYCSLFGGAATTTQDDAESLPGLACTHIRSISTTWLDTTGATRSALPASCTPTIGRSLDNSNSGTLFTATAAASSEKKTVSTATSWADTNEVSIWIAATCSGSPTRGVALVVTCD